MLLYKMIGRAYARSAVCSCMPLLFIAASAAFANQAPTVNAGDDQLKARINDMNVFLFGEASDDSTPAENLIFLWTQVSGPALAVIADSAEILSRISFPQTGTYTIELQVSDGVLFSRDSTSITVLDSLPFIILAPQRDAQIQIAQPYVIRWQLEPMRMCEVAYSLDNGITYIRISPNAVRDSLAWTFDSTYKDSARQGIIAVYEYQNNSFKTVSTFTLVDSLTGIKPAQGGATSRTGQHVSIDQHGMLRIAGIRKTPAARIRVFSANGATILSSRVHGRAITVTAPHSGVLIYRMGDKSGRIVRQSPR